MKNKIIYVKLFILIIFVSVIGCNKEKVQLNALASISPASEDIHQVLYINDSVGFACGGLKYLHGIILKTTDAGTTWDTSLNVGPKVFYTIVKEGNKLFATGFDGYMFMSADTGRSWQEINSPKYKRFNQLCFTNSHHVFAAAGEGFTLGKIYQSDDEGNSWYKEDTFEKSIKSIYFLDELNGFAGSYGSIYRTDNGGGSWQPTTATGDFFVKIQFCSPKVGYASGYFGKVLKTSDGGTTWNKVLNENFQFNEKSNFNDMYFINETMGYVVGNKGYMVKTDDGGNSWQQIDKFTTEDLLGIAINNGVATIVCSHGKIYKLNL